jgi:hypothetical protein
MVLAGSEGEEAARQAWTLRPKKRTAEVAAIWSHVKGCWLDVVGLAGERNEMVRWPENLRIGGFAGNWRRNFGDLGLGLGYRNWGWGCRERFVVQRNDMRAREWVEEWPLVRWGTTQIRLGKMWLATIILLLQYLPSLTKLKLIRLSYYYLWCF